MATGFYVRVQRDGKWQNVELDALTDEELRAFFGDQSGDRCRTWAIALAAWIRDHVVSPEREHFE